MTVENFPVVAGKVHMRLHDICDPKNQFSVYTQQNSTCTFKVARHFDSHVEAFNGQWNRYFTFFPLSLNIGQKT